MPYLGQVRFRQIGPCPNYNPQFKCALFKHVAVALMAQHLAGRALEGVFTAGELAGVCKIAYTNDAK